MDTLFVSDCSAIRGTEPPRVHATPPDDYWQ